MIYRLRLQPVFKIGIKDVSDGLWRAVGRVAAAVAQRPEGVQVVDDLRWSNFTVISDEDTLSDPWSHRGNWNLEMIQKKVHSMFRGGGGGIVVSIIAFCSDDPSSNPAGYWIFLNCI